MSIAPPEIDPQFAQIELHRSEDGNSAIVWAEVMASAVPRQTCGCTMAHHLAVSSVKFILDIDGVPWNPAYASLPFRVCKCNFRWIE